MNQLYELLPNFPRPMLIFNPKVHMNLYFTIKNLLQIILPVEENYLRSPVYVFLLLWSKMMFILKLYQNFIRFCIFILAYAVKHFVLNTLN